MNQTYTIMQAQPTNQNIKRKMLTINEYGSGYGQYCILDDYTHKYAIQQNHYIENIYSKQDLESGENLFEKYKTKKVDEFLSKITNYTLVSSIAIFGTIYFFKYF